MLQLWSWGEDYSGCTPFLLTAGRSYKELIVLELRHIFKLAELPFPNTGHFFLMGQAHPATQHKAAPQHGVAHCVFLTYTINSWRVQRSNNFCTFFSEHLGKKKDIHVLVYSTLPYCTSKAQAEGSSSAGFNDVKPVSAAFLYLEEPPSPWFVERVTRQGLQEWQSHCSPCDAESSDGKKKSKNEATSTHSALELPLLSPFLKSFTSLFTHLCSLEITQRARHNLISHTPLFTSSGASLKAMYLKGLDWRKHRWNQWLLLLNSVFRLLGNGKALLFCASDNLNIF